MPAAVQKSGTMTKKGSLVVEETAESVVIALINAPPDKRPAEAMKLRVMLTEPGGVFLVWDQLCRTRKNFGSQAGLFALLEMLNAKADKYQIAGHEPAIQCLATFCNTKEYVMIIGKLKKILHGLMNILSEPTASVRITLLPQQNTAWLPPFKAKESASWVLRRTTEFCKQARSELGSDRDALQTISRVLRGGDDGDVRSRLGSPEENGRRISEDQMSFATHSYQPSPVNSRPGTRPVSREPSRPPSRENSVHDFPIGVAESSTPTAKERAAGKSEASNRQLLSRESTAGGKDHSMSRSGPLPGLGQPVVKEGSISMSRSGPVPVNLNLNGGPVGGTGRLLKEPSRVLPGGTSMKGQAVLPAPPLTEQQLAKSLGGTGGGWDSGDDPFSLMAGGSRPQTTFANGTQVITFTSEPDQMSIEGNLCAALGNAAHSDEVLERLGKTEGIVLGVIYLLQYGSDWARGHAGRTLGNLAYTPENCKFLMQVDRENAAVHSLCGILASDVSRRSKEWALHAIANLSRNSNLCASFNRTPGLLLLLQQLGQQGIEREDVDRAVANLSQARLGTRTWRQPRKL